MARIDLARRAEIGREKRARTRAQIVDAGLVLLAERPPEGLTIDAIVETAGVAKGTFYYHFQSIEELVAAAGAKLADSFDELLTPSRLEVPDPIERIAFAFTKFLEKALDEPVWASACGPKRPSSRLRSAGIRENLKADLAEAMAQGRAGHTGRGARGRSRDRVSGFKSPAAVLSDAPRRSFPAKRATPCCELLA